MVKTIVNESNLDQKLTNEYAIARMELKRLLNKAHYLVIEEIIDKFDAALPTARQPLSTIVTALDDAIAASFSLPCHLDIQKLNLKSYLKS